MLTIRMAAIALVLPLVACSKPAAEGNEGAAASSAALAPAGRVAPVDFGHEELEAYEKGIVEETELVVAAEGKMASAATAEARAAAAQAQWDAATIPVAAKEVGLSEGRYREIRGAINRAFENLDYQGKIDGPMEMETMLASPPLKARLTADPFGHLTPSAAAGLKGRLDRLTPLWIKYVRLTAASQ
jgi:hypothetical protein